MWDDRRRWPARQLIAGLSALMIAGLAAGCETPAGQQQDKSLREATALRAALREESKQRNYAHIVGTEQGKLPPNYQLTIMAWLMTDWPLARHDKPHPLNTQWGATPFGGLACGDVAIIDPSAPPTPRQPFIASFDSAGRLTEVDVIDAQAMDGVRAARSDQDPFWSDRYLLKKCGVAL